MLEELREYDNIGSSEFFREVLELFHINQDTYWTEESLAAHFKGKIIGGKDIFNGGLRLLVLIGAIEQDISGVYHLTYAFKQKFYSEEHCKGRVLEALIVAMSEDDDTYTIFSQEHCSYDIVHNAIQISTSAFGLQYSNIRDVLVNLGLLESHPNFPKTSYVIRSNRRLFDKHFTKGIKRHQVSPEELMNRQEQQRENGQIGEEYVLKFESRRTNRHDDIIWIASYDTNAGFDVLSYQSNSSKEHDRFIEVKAYKGIRPYFYWSRNEIKTAEAKGTMYYLYLVNIDKIKESDYCPIIVQNPAKNVLKNDAWHKNIEKYKIIKT